MWKNTEVTRRLGLGVPIVQGPFGGGLSSIDLVTAVCEFGGLGSFGVHHLDAPDILEVARGIRARTGRPFALNLWIPTEQEKQAVSDEMFDNARRLLKPYFDELAAPLPARPERFGPSFDEQIEAVMDARPAVFSFVYGVPEPAVLRRCADLGIVTLGTATTPEEAQALQSAGVNMIVATGFEAGGHRVSFLRSPAQCLTGTLSLVPQVVDAVRVPVIAAGGIADGRGIAAALMLGAQAVQIGTAFLACEQSNAHPLHRDRLFSEDAKRTALTSAFTGRLARGIHTHFIEAMRSQEHSFASYPVQAWLVSHLKAAAIRANRSDLMPLWCGQSAPLLSHRDAQRLMNDLVAQTSSRLSALNE